jgi:DNA invertase Pin-like site-specific DNA recombinase
MYMPERKVTATDVQEIRYAAEQGESYTWIAAQYGIHDRTVGRIVTRETWDGVLPPTAEELETIEANYDERKFWEEV